MGTDRITRLLRLVMLLESGRTPSASAIQLEMGISRRTFFRDLKTLQEAGVPCFHERGKGYRIARSFYLPPMNLTVTETLGLLLLGKNALASRKRPLSVPGLSAISKLVASLPEPIREACDDMMRHVSVQPPPQVESDEESQFYPILQRCIDEMRVCSIKYKSPVQPDAMTLLLRPYALHFATRAWYVLGHSELHGEVRMFKLSRVIGLDMTNDRFDRPADFHVSSHLGKAWSVIPEGKVETIELEFKAKVATNVAEVLWHPTQTHEFLDDGRLRMQFEIDGLTEISWWLCGYADQVTVIKPKLLRERVEAMHRAAIEATHNAHE